MKNILLRLVRQSPAMIVAMLALFVALTGTAVATTSALIGSAQIRNNSITGLDVKNRSLRPIDFRGSVRGPRGLRGLTGATGATGAAGAAGAAGAKGDKGDIGPSNVFYVTMPPGLTTITAVVSDPTDTLIRQITLGAGTYLVSANVLVINNGAGDAEPRCFLRDPSGAELVGGPTGLYQNLQPSGVANIFRLVLPLQGTVTLAASGNVTVECNKAAAAENVGALAGITAIKVGSAAAS